MPRTFHPPSSTSRTQKYTFSFRHFIATRLVEIPHLNLLFRRPFLRSRRSLLFVILVLVVRPRQSFVFIAPVLTTERTRHGIVRLGCALVLSFVWGVPISRHDIRFSRICPRHGVYSPRSHSPSSYTYSLRSRSFGFYPILSSFTLVVLVFATSPRHSFSSFAPVILVLATSFALSPLCPHQQRSLFCKLRCRSPLNSISDPSVPSPSRNCPTARLFPYLRFH